MKVLGLLLLLVGTVDGAAVSTAQAVDMEEDFGLSKFFSLGPKLKSESDSSGSDEVLSTQYKPKAPKMDSWESDEDSDSSGSDEEHKIRKQIVPSCHLRPSAPPGCLLPFAGTRT